MIFFPDKFAQRIFLCGIGIQLILSSLLPISLSADSYQYLRLAYTPFNISDWDNRPFGYPLFLKLALFNSGFGLIFIIFFQTILSALMPNILYSTFYKQYNFAAKFVAIMFLIYPYYNFLSLQVMTDTLFIFLLLLCIYFIFQFFRDIGIKNLIIVNLVIFIAASVRPSAQILFLAVPGTIFLYFLFNFKSREVIKIFLISVVLGFGTMKFYSSTLPEWGKSFGSFINYYKYMSSLCLIEDFEKIKKIKINNSIFVPDDDYFYLIENTLEQLKVREQNKFISNNFITQDNYFSEKCFSTENNLNANDYLLKVEELLEIDPFLKKQLTHYYDVKLSPTDELNPMFANLSNSEIVKIVHNKVIHGQPYIFIYFSMARNYGFDETNKIIKDLVYKNYSRNDYFYLKDKSKKTLSLMSPVSINQESDSFYNKFLKKSLESGGKLVHDSNFWRFIIRTNNTVEDQNANFIFSVNENIFKQNIYNLERLNNYDYDQIYQLNEELWKIIEEDLGIDNSNVLSQFSENKVNVSLLEKSLNNKNIVNFTLQIIWLMQDISSMLFKYLIIIFIPLSMILFIRNTLKKQNYSNDQIISISLCITGIVSLFLSTYLFFDFRHFNFALPMMIPMLITTFKNE